MEDPILMDEYEMMMDSFDEELAAAIGEEFQNCLSPDGTSSSSTLFPRSSSTTTLCASSSSLEPPSQPQQLVLERPTKQHKPNSYMPNFDQSSSVPIILSFGASNLQDQHGPLNPEDEDEAAKGGHGVKKSGARVRPPSQTYDHIIAERKRREQLSQLFVALSAIVPGLKKMDKTSVLGDAIKYLKQLQERVKTLEQQATKQTMESVVLVKKSQLFIEDEDSSDENFHGGSSDESLPEIEARLCDKSILLRIHCEKHKGVLVKILSEVEKINLAIVNTSVSPFGSLALDITIIAEMEKGFCLTVKDIVKTLRSALLRVTKTA